MYTDVEIINLGTSLLAASPIDQIAPPLTQNEKYFKRNYTQWKRSELTKRRWVFATAKNYTLTQVSTTEPGSKPYKYQMPNDCLRLIRRKDSEWEQRGTYIYSAYSTLTVDYVRNVPESDFDPLFVDVLAARIAKDSAEYITQSQSKKEYAASVYLDTVRAAGKANAFVIGPEDIDEEDGEPTWLEAHHNG